MDSWAKEVNSTAFSPDGRHLVTGGPDGAARLWDLATGRELRTFEGHSSAVWSMAISPDGRFLAATGLGRAAKLWDLATGQELRTFIDPLAGMKSVAISPDGKQLATTGTLGFYSSSAKLWDLATGQEIRTLGRSETSNSAAFSQDGRHLATGGSDGTAKIWDLATGQVFRTFKGHADAVASVVFSLDGRHLITGSSDNTAKLWDLAASPAIRTFRGHSGVVNSVAASPDGKHLATGSGDGTVRVWDLASGKELFALISMATGSVVVTPEGYFDGSPEAMTHIRWTAGFESYPMEAFSEGYYTPGLLARIMAGETVAAPGQPGLSKGFALPPLVRISSPENGAQSAAETVTVDVRASDQGGGVDEIRLYHNGKAVQGSARGMKAAARDSAERTESFQVTLVEGENRLRALAMSRDRIEGNPYEITVFLKGPEKQAALHVLVVGVNQYKNSAMNLNYAQPDAKAIAGFFGAAPGRLFKEVRLHELYDGAATKAGILAKLAELQNTPPQDVVLVYLAGHGESLENVWYFLPHELAYPEREGEIKAKGLSSAELQAAVKAMGAQKILLLMDACKSGGALLAFAGRGVEDRKALAMLARASGVHVAAASTDSQIAAEVKDLGHGVFTYTLLQALAGRADGSPRDGTVTVRELLSYVESRLPEISQKYKTQAQYPVVDSRGMDFPVTSADR